MRLWLFFCCAGFDTVLPVGRAADDRRRDGVACWADEAGRDVCVVPEFADDPERAPGDFQPDEAGMVNGLFQKSSLSQSNCDVVDELCDDAAELCFTGGCEDDVVCEAVDCVADVEGREDDAVRAAACCAAIVSFKSAILRIFSSRDSCCLFASAAERRLF